MNAVSARRKSAIEPRTCSCVVIGFCPISGTRKRASVHASGFALAAGFLALAAFARPVVVGPPAAGIFVAVVDPTAAGRAAALGFDPPKPKSPPSEDFGLSACTLAM